MAVLKCRCGAHKSTGESMVVLHGDWSNLIQSLKRGSKIGEKLFVSSSSYGSSYLSGDNGNVISERRRSLQFPLSYGSEEQSDDESDHESENNFSDYEDKELVVAVGLLSGGLLIVGL